ncbi:MAG: pentapeptide repeat-containing protein [Treponemataceae bacterium]|nr:pentapeptide repeat-containing protein [Treponemataceae bacterium]
MFSWKKCACPGCTKNAVSDFDGDGHIIDGDYCLMHAPDPEGITRKVHHFINHTDKIIGLNASGIVFGNIQDFRLTGKRFYGCNFSQCVFRALHARGFRCRMTTFDFAVFIDCDLLGSNMQFTSFAGAKFSHVLFTGSDMIQDNFTGLESFQSSFDDSDLYNSRFIKARLIDTSIRNCNIKKTVFREIEQQNLSFKLSNTNEAIFDERGSALFTGMKELDNPVGARV